MASKNKTLKLPYDFDSDPKLRALQFLSGATATQTMGRVVLLALATYQLRKLRFRASELDTIMEWQHPVCAADALVRVGWAHKTDTMGVVVLTLPEFLRPLKAHKAGGDARAKGALRNQAGKFVRKEKAPDRQEGCPQETIW